MKKHILTVLIILLTIISGASTVYGEEIEENILTNSSEEENRIGQEVKSNENGHYNISFNDGYNGYCINYGNSEASRDDSFTVKNTSSAVNTQTGESVGNCLKVFFVDYYDIAMKDKVETQKIIWGFTGGYNYYNQSLLDEIRNVSSGKTIPDHGIVKKINDTTEAIFDFEVLEASKSSHQNFFAYKITYREIIEEIMNTSAVNSTINNTVKNQSEESELQNKTSNSAVIKKEAYSEKQKLDETYENTENPTKLLKNKTGNSLIILLLTTLLTSVVLIKYKRD